MPIAVACTCGKQFRVRDDQAGTLVNCQVCGAQCQVPLSDAVGVIAPPAAKLASAPLEIENTINCPACAEKIPAASRKCPLCSEVLKAGEQRLSDEEKTLLLEAAKKSLDSYSPSMDPVAASRFATKTIILGIITALFVVIFLMGFVVQSRDSAVFHVFGVIFGLAFGIPFLISLSNDSNASTITESKSAEQAFKNYFMAIRTGRIEKAYRAVAPIGRKAENADSIRFKNPKIEHAPKVRHFSDAKSFKAYWKQIFSGPSPYNRNLTLKNVHVVGRSGNVVVVEGTLNVTSYNSLLLLLIFLNWLIALIVVLVTQQKDELRLRKALINHRGKWYILDGAFESQVDRSI